MKDNLIKINYNNKEIILIPTAHVSVESVELVKKTIETQKPDSVCIELDEGRYKNLLNPEAWKSTNIIDVIKQKKVAMLIANLILSSYQKNIAKKLKTKPGQEMIQGMDSANKVGAELILADRNIQTTFMRIWRKMGFFEKMKVLASLLFANDEDDISEEDLSNLIERSNLENVIGDLGNSYPQIAETLLHERDEYLAYNIKNAPGDKIVAVLGAAHTPGIEKEIFKEQNISELDKIPEKSFSGKIIPWIIPVLIIGLIIYSFYQSIGAGMTQIKSWFIFNSLFAAGFTALSLAHPLSILTSFIVAPFTSVNPLLACGWFAGLVEATLRKPTVEDVNKIPEDIFKLKSWLKNKFLKALLVVIMANIGSSIGTLIAGTKIVQNIL
ncbi:pheromone shutdown-related protein TraB [Peptoniphilus olsenii]|uniref:Pheromone shutdown-related protein TraB n=1 Tax=Peptoniphilus olsenii TaxID=411570 RepID=A0ABV2J6P3_9FIRM